jgi:predicted nucleic acid-binding protein
MVVVDTNVLVELFLPSNKAESVQDWWIAEPDWLV